MKPTVALFLLCFVLSPGYAIGQSSRTDSLRSEIKEAGNDTSAVSLLLQLTTEQETPPADLERLSLLYQIASESFRIDPDTTLVVASQGLELSEELDHEAGLADGHYWSGLAHWVLGNGQTALDHFYEAIRLYQDIGDKKMEARVNLGIGEVLFQEAWDQAYPYFESALDISNELGDPYGRSDALNGVGTVYAYRNELQRFLDHELDALAIRNDVPQIPPDGGLGFFYPDRELLNNIGYAYGELGEYDLAIDHYQRSLASFREDGVTFQQAYTLTNVGRAYGGKGDWEQARVYAEEAVDLASKHGYLDDTRYSADFLKEVYRELGDYEKAYETFQLFVHTRDSINFSAVEKTAADMQAQFEREKAEARIRMILITVSLVLALMVVFWLVLFNRFRVIKQLSDTLQELAEKLSKYLSPQIYQSIFSGETDVTVSTNRKKLTVFFSDIKDFTATTEDLQPEDLTFILNDYFTAMSSIVREHGGTLDKFIGDAIVVFFGDPTSKGVKEDASACVRMAIEMQQQMHILRRKWEDLGYEKPLHMRVGINTGYCNVGNFGSDDRLDYTIIGGEVNLAARLEGITEPDGVTMSYETYVNVKDFVRAEEQPAIQVKGIRRDVRPFKVVGLFDESAKDGGYIREQLPGMSLTIDLANMTNEDRVAARKKLEESLEAISGASN